MEEAVNSQRREERRKQHNYTEIGWTLAPVIRLAKKTKLFGVKISICHWPIAAVISYL